MGIENLHPAYEELKDEWVMMRDFYKGERVVKERGEEYLPSTQAMRLDGMGMKDLGRAAYNAYLKRAVFPDLVKEGVEVNIGLLWQKPPTIELPAKLEALRESATLFGEPLELLLRRINEEQLVTGRVGLMLDLPTTPDQANPLPYIATYTAESVKNWDDAEAGEGTTNLNLVVLDESGYRREGFEWVLQRKYRVLVLDQSGKYRQAVYVDNLTTAVLDPETMTEPTMRGAPLKVIPFVFANTKDIVASPDRPPLLGLAQMARSIYMGEADYRQSLFMQGQDTLVVIGAAGGSTDLSDTGNGEPLRTGAGSRINIEVGGDAKYIGVSSSGLSEQRTALENDRKRAETRSGQLMTGKGAQIESGEAMQTRIGAQTATLNQIAMTGASALEYILKIAADWVGADREQVKVTPNLEFANYDMSGKELTEFMAARTMGAPISKESIHAMMVRKGVTELDYETEIGKVSEEDANLPRVNVDPDGGTE